MLLIHNAWFSRPRPFRISLAGGTAQWPQEKTSRCLQLLEEMTHGPPEPVQTHGINPRPNRLLALLTSLAGRPSPQPPLQFHLRMVTPVHQG